MDSGLILECGRLCQLSYANGHAIGFKNVGDLRYGITEFQDKTIVTFRGTANTRNAMRDLTVFPAIKWAGFKTHHGFVDAARKLAPILDDELAGVSNIVFNGHSFGGALAVLYTLLYEETQAITFGCPKTHFWFFGVPSANVIYIKCDDDPVPMMPMATGRHVAGISIVLADKDDEWIDVADHNIKVYNQRLSAYKWSK